MKTKTTRPALTFAEDAARIRERARREWGGKGGYDGMSRNQGGGRGAEQMTKAGAFQARVAEAMDPPATVREIAAMLGEAESRVRWAVKVMVDQGRVIGVGKRKPERGRPQIILSAVVA